MKPREVWSLAQARDALGRLIGGVAEDWVSLDQWLIEFCVDPKLRRSARASSFSASLELVREGLIELRQEAHFAPLFLRKLDKDEGARKLALVET
jgi:segregation and condensation protein A